MLFGLVNGLNVSDRRSNEMSKKSTDFLHVSFDGNFGVVVAERFTYFFFYPFYILLVFR